MGFLSWRSVLLVVMGTNYTGSYKSNYKTLLPPEEVIWTVFEVHYNTMYITLFFRLEFDLFLP